MKIALITDTHFGARNDNVAFGNYFKKFYDEVFFPYVDEHDIKQVIHLGDTVDRRKFINFMTARNLKQSLLEPLAKRDLEVDFIIGNHDTYYKNTNEVNSLRELGLVDQYDKFNVIWEPEEKTYDDCKIMLMPWICSGNYDDCMRAINETSAQVLFGHLELKGFEMQRGIVNDHGFDSNLFGKFDIVCSGHYHHKSSYSNISYLGSPYEIFWSDYDDPRGFHVFDTETREIEFIRNPNRIFHKIWYDDMDKAMDEVIAVDFEPYKDSYVKVIVRNKTNPYWFDLVIDKLEKIQPIDIQVVEDHFNLDLEEDTDIVDRAEDTLTILHKYVKSLPTKVDKNRLDSLMRELYTEAISIS